MLTNKLILGIVMHVITSNEAVGIRRRLVGFFNQMKPILIAKLPLEIETKGIPSNCSVIVLINKHSI